LTFLGRSGLYAISPAALGYDVTIQPGDGLVMNLAKNRVEKLIREMADPTKASAIFDAHNQRYMLAYTDENGVRNNRILVFDWSAGGFTEYTGLSCNDLLCRLNGDVLGAINQYIIKFGEGYRDFDDQPIRMVARTKQYNLDYPFHKKNLLNLYCSSGSLGWARRKARCACTWTTSCGPRFWSPHCTPTSCGVSASGGTFGVFATPSPPAPAFSARAIGCRWSFATSSWTTQRPSTAWGLNFALPGPKGGCCEWRFRVVLSLLTRASRPLERQDPTRLNTTWTMPSPCSILRIPCEPGSRAGLTRMKTSATFRWTKTRNPTRTPERFPPY